MAYSPPTGNAVAFNFTAPYSAPAGNGVVLNFGTLSPPGTSQATVRLLQIAPIEEEGWTHPRARQFRSTPAVGGRRRQMLVIN